jgi:hypothetical protein
VAAQEEDHRQAEHRDWLAAMRDEVGEHLKTRQVRMTAPPDLRWDRPLYVAVWRIDGGWVISGNVPTDHVMDETIPTPREAVRFFAVKLAETVSRMADGSAEGTPQRRRVDLLQRRARLLFLFADDDRFWPDEPDDTQEATE